MNSRVASERGDLGSEMILSIVVVSYNSWSDVARLVEELATTSAVESGRCEVVVVDNASSSPAPASLESPRPNLHVIHRSENGGFSAGVNTGWRAACGRWILLLNPDVVPGPDLPGRVLGRLKHHEARAEGPPGIVGFRLENSDGTPQPSVGYEPNLLRSLRGLFLPRSRRKYQPASRLRSLDVPWVTGACLLVSRQVLEAIGGMDEDFFLYYEEVALCSSARRLDWRVEFDPSLGVVHCHPLQNRRLTPPMRLITRHSLLLYFWKFLPRWEFQLVSRLVEVEAWLRWIVAGIGCRGHERRSNREIAALARSMRAGFIPKGCEIRDVALEVAGGKSLRTNDAVVVERRAGQLKRTRMPVESV